jgi:hypothetical protein
MLTRAVRLPMRAQQERDPMKTVVLICAVAGLLSVACDNSGSTNTTAATTVAPASVTDNFSGTLQVGATNTHTFNVSQVGTLTATLTAVGPPATVFVGFAVGTYSGTTCTLAATINTQASATPQLSGTASVTGQWCIQVSDIGNLSAPATYTITVAHP